LSEPERPRASPALTVIHAVVFLGFAGLAIAAASPELAQLRFALAGPYHAGSTPFWPALAGAALAAGGALVLLWRVARRQEVTLFVSLSIMLGLAVAVSVNWSRPSQRSAHAANVALLEIARELQRKMGAVLQKDAAVPEDGGAWAAKLAEALEAKPDAASALRDRGFRRLDYQAVRVEAEAWQGEGALPGTIGVWISSDRVVFLLTPVGITEEGKPRVLPDDRGNPIRLRGVYNPDMH
jgi:hypothetical protein